MKKISDVGYSRPYKWSIFSTFINAQVRDMKFWFGKEATYCRHYFTASDFGRLCSIGHKDLKPHCSGKRVVII